MPDTTSITTTKYATIITAVGEAKIAAAILNGTKVNIVLAAVGDGNGSYYKPTAEQTSLLNECWRGKIASYQIGSTVKNMIDIKFLIPADVGGFFVREAMVIDDEGDVIALCNTPAAEKVAISEGASFPLTMMMHIIVKDASAINVMVQPSLDTVSREEMHGAIDEAMRGAGITEPKSVTIPVSAWGESGENEYGYVADVAVDCALAAHFPSMALQRDSLKSASQAGLCPTIEALDGILRFWAIRIPSADLHGMVLLCAAGTHQPSLPEGEEFIEIATDEEVAGAVEEIFGESAVATNAEVEEAINDIFGQEP